MQNTFTSKSTRKSALIAIAISFALGTSGYAMAQEYESPEPPEEEQEEEEGEQSDLTPEELAEQQARQAMEENQPTDYSGDSLADMLSSEAYFERFHQALEQTGWLDELDPDQEYTVFAPFDEALNRLPEGVWENWTEGNDSEEFREFIGYHIVEGTYSSSDLSDEAQQVTTLNGEDIELRSAYGAMMVGHVSVNMPDIETNQGYVQGIDSVLGDTSQFSSESDEE